MDQTRLTEHFTLQELTKVGDHAGIDNTPPQSLAANAILLAGKLEQARDIWSGAIGREVRVRVSYGYRCPALNHAVGGSETSAHLEFLAADLIPEGLDLRQAFDLLVQDPEFMAEVDQLIIERGCIHVGLPPARRRGVPRRELRLDQDGVNGSRAYPLFGYWTSQGVQRA